MLLDIFYFTFLIFKRFYSFFFRVGKGGRKRGRETSMCGCLSHAPYWEPVRNPGMCPRLGVKMDLLVHRLALNPLSHTSQGCWIYFKAITPLKKFQIFFLNSMVEKFVKYILFCVSLFSIKDQIRVLLGNKEGNKSSKIHITGIWKAAMLTTIPPTPWLISLEFGENDENVFYGYLSFSSGYM